DLRWHTRRLPCCVYCAAEVDRLPARFYAKICPTFAHSRCEKIGCRNRDPTRTKHVRNLPPVTMTPDSGAAAATFDLRGAPRQARNVETENYAAISGFENLVTFET